MQHFTKILAWLTLLLFSGQAHSEVVITIQVGGGNEMVSSYLSWNDLQNGTIARSLVATNQPGILVAFCSDNGKISTIRKVNGLHFLYEYSSFANYIKGNYGSRTTAGRRHIAAIRGLATDGTRYWSQSYVGDTSHIITYSSKENLIAGVATEDFDLGWPADLARDIAYSGGEFHLIYEDKMITYRNLSAYKSNDPTSILNLPSNLPYSVGISAESGVADPLAQPTTNIPLQDSGLTRLIPVAPYLNGTFPANTPGAGSWQVVNAFPNLGFLEPMQVLGDPSRPGTLLVVGLSGHIWRIPNDSAAAAESKQLLLDISRKVERLDNEHGLYGIELHPQFANPASPSAGFLYAVYLHPRPDLRGYLDGHTKYWRLSRFTMNLTTGIIDPTSEVILINQYCPGIYHNGGAMFFGKDGLLYVTVGDNERPAETAQLINGGLRSGVLRLDVDMDPTRSHPIRRQPSSADVPVGWPASYSAYYFIPNDNPWQSPAGENLEEFYAVGLRNPYTMSMDALTGQAWIGDVGDISREEISLMDQPGLNFQWPYREGNTVTGVARPPNLIGTDRAPELEYGRSDGGVIIFGFVYRSVTYENELGGKLLFSDNNIGTIWAYDPISHVPKLELANAGSGGGNNVGVVNLCEGPNGEVFIPFQAGRGALDGQIRKLSPATITVQPPSRLSETHAFKDLVNLTPHAAFIPFEPAASLWSDEAGKYRWIAVPNDGSPASTSQRISLTSENWQFPAGTVIMKHFEMPVDENNPDLRQRLETRFIVCQPGGGKYGVTYRWLEDGSDAELMTGRSTVNYTVARKSGATVTRQWSVPSRADCLSCHTTASGQALGLKTHQLNHDLTYPATGLRKNQMSTLGYLGLLYPARDSQELAAALRAHGIEDKTAPLEHRVRSYLDVNCSHCHQPNGGGPGFDARLYRPLVAQSLINENTKGHFIFTPEGKLVNPGDVGASALHFRASSSTAGIAMPPLARNVVDTTAVREIAHWIRTLHPEEFVNTVTPTGRFFRLRSLSEVNGEPWAAVAELKIIGSNGVAYPQSKLTVSAVSSANSDQPGSLAIDGDSQTMWTSEWAPNLEQHPHSITIDLRSSKPIAGFEYQPRNDGSENGRIAKWEAEISTDGETWQPFLAGTFPNTGSLQRSIVKNALFWPVRPRIAVPASVVNGDFEVIITTDTDVTDFVLADLADAVTNGSVTALRGAGHYYVATIHPTGSPVTIQLTENIMGHDFSAASNTATVGYLEEAPKLSAELLSSAESGQQARVRLNLSQPLTNPSSVRLFARSGTALEAQDFIAFDQTVAIPIGVGYVDVTLSLIKHAQFVPGRAFFLELEPGAGYTVAQAELNVPISEDEQSIYSDTDADGLPDVWEITQFGNLSQSADGDPDGDLISNYLEYLLGTAPELPGEYVSVTSLQIAAGGVTVAWTSVAGVDYDLYVSSDLSTWTRHGGASIPATGSHTSATLDLPAGLYDERVFVKVAPKESD